MEVLPKVGYRQWTLSLPFALLWPVVKQPKLLRVLERCLTRAIFRAQRARAKQLGHSSCRRRSAITLPPRVQQVPVRPTVRGIVARGPIAIPGNAGCRLLP